MQSIRLEGIGLFDQNSPRNAEAGFRARLDRILELLIGSSFGAAIIYSLFWGAFQSLAVGHFIINEGRFVAVAATSITKSAAPKTPVVKSDDESDSSSSGETGDAIEIWYASALHRSVWHPCTLDFEFTGMNITNYTFGSERRHNPHQARYLPVLGIAKNPKLPGPFIYLHFESALGSSPTYQLNFDFKKDAAGNTVGLPKDKQTFVATTELVQNPWQCVATVFIGGGIKIVDFSDFAFAKVPEPDIQSSNARQLPGSGSDLTPSPAPADQSQGGQRNGDH